ILAGVTQLFATTRSNSVLSDGQSRIQENMRYIMSQLEYDAGQVGSLGCFSQAFRKDANVVGDILSIDNETAAGPSSLRRFDVSKMINGTDNDGTLNSDTVLFRYA